MNCGNHVPNTLMDKVNSRWLARIKAKPATFHGSNLTHQEIRNLRNSGVVSRVGYNAKKQGIYGPGPIYDRVLEKMNENGKGD